MIGPKMSIIHIFHYNYIQQQLCTYIGTYIDIIDVIIKSHYEEVIVVITRVRGRAEDECNNNDNLRVQWDLTGFYPIVFDMCHVTQ